MAYVTFGDARRLADEAGLVMSRREDGIFLRFRDPGAGCRTWSGLRAAEVVEIVKALKAS